jgi:hypothetical protein
LTPDVFTLLLHKDPIELTGYYHKMAKGLINGSAKFDATTGFISPVPIKIYLKKSL